MIGWWFEVYDFLFLLPAFVILIVILASHSCTPDHHSALLGFEDISPIFLWGENPGKSKASIR
jgi:hypothetical protein